VIEEEGEEEEEGSSRAAADDDDDLQAQHDKEETTLHGMIHAPGGRNHVRASSSRSSRSSSSRSRRRRRRGITIRTSLGPSTSRRWRLTRGRLVGVVDLARCFALPMTPFVKGGPLSFLSVNSYGAYGARQELVDEDSDSSDPPKRKTRGSFQ
jgi:hypothetical protein